MDFEKMRPELVAEQAKEIMISANKVKDVLDRAKKDMNTLNDSWDSKAARKVSERFTTLSSNFTNFYQAITAYSKFIDDAQKAYVEAHSEVEKLAEDLLSEG